MCEENQTSVVRDLDTLKERLTHGFAWAESHFSTWARTQLPVIGVGISLFIVGWMVINTITGMLQRRLQRIRVSTKLSDIGGLGVFAEADTSDDDDSASEDEQVSSGDRRNAKKATRPLEPTLLKFAVNFVTACLRVLLLFCIAPLLGIRTTSFLAIFTTFSLAVGLALQGILKDVARGVMLTLLRPFKIGDVISVANEEVTYIGKCVEIGIFYTVLRTSDNRTHVIPNNLVNTITNITGQGSNRVDMPVTILREDGISRPRAALLSLASSERSVLRGMEPPQVFVSDINETTIEIVLRVWLRADDRDRFNTGFREKIISAFEKDGLTLLAVPRLEIKDASLQ